MKLPRIPQLPLWVWIAAGLVATTVGGLGALGLMHYTTAQPSVCLSCHATGETLNVGAPSRVHPGLDKVGCPDCHAQPPGFVIVGRRHPYSADPEVVSANCLRCHPEIAQADKVDFKFNELGINIPHVLHLEKVGANCLDCHSNIAHDLGPDATNRPHMAACVKCHDKPSSKACYACHTEGSLTTSNTSGPISRSECVGCHEGFAGAALQVDGLDFSHQPHLANGLPCKECHAAGGRHGQVSQTKESCLNGCHKARKPMTHTSAWAGEHGEQSAADGERCQTCHQKEFCDDCHGTSIPHPANWRTSHASGGRESLCQKCHTSDFCSDCHAGRRPRSHSSGWRTTHGGAAQADSRGCKTCHSSGQCDRCHGEKMPHPADWLESGHQAQATQSAGQCATCHEGSFCDDCHGTDMPHPSGWLTAHSSSATDTPGLCSTCHVDSDCRTCHRSSAAVPHPPEWRREHASAAAGEEQFCALCHGDAPCLECHGTEMPHPENWTLTGHKESASFDESSTCLKCHETDLCNACHGTE